MLVSHVVSLRGWQTNHLSCTSLATHEVWSKLRVVYGPFGHVSTYPPKIMAFLFQSLIQNKDSSYID